MGSEQRERMRALGVRLRALRAEAGLTGAVLAQWAHVGQPTVSKVENGRMVPSLDVLGRLSRALGLDEATALEVRDLLAAVEAAVDSGGPEDGAASTGVAADDEVRSARLVRSFQCVVLPAMLQSAEYARHVFEMRRARRLSRWAGLLLPGWSGRACCANPGASRYSY